MKNAPSILSADFSRLGDEIISIKNAGADWVHLDVMDGHFVPNISFGLPVIKSIRKLTDMFFDVHLMISEPQKYVRLFCEAGADIVTFHVEACTTEEALFCIDEIHACGKQAGISIKPGTPVSSLEPFRGLVEMVLVMTVEPGFGGQKFIADMMPKIGEIKCLMPGVIVEIDGGVNGETVKTAAENGVDVVVAGSYVFGAEDRKAAIESLRV